MVHPHVRFNPTLVRLRLAVAAAHRDSQSVFQSHAGSIEAAAIYGLPPFQIVVSIPRWFD